LHSRAPESGSAYEYSFGFSPIAARTLGGELEASFFLFYTCNGNEADCRAVEETISVEINGETFVYAYDDLANNPAWAQKSVQINSLDENNNLDVYLEYLFPNKMRI
jgi:hypothetical protein